MAERVIYRVEENTPSATATEQVLNELAEDGWRVIGFSQYQILLKKEITNEQAQLLNEGVG